MTTSATDVAKTLQHVRRTVGRPVAWSAWPGGWPDDIEAALVDSVFSARAVYHSKWGRGIYPKVVSWANGRDRTSFSLKELLTEIDAVGVSAWALLLGNEQLSPRRPASAPEGSSKAATVRQAAALLTENGISAAAQITATNAVTVKQTLRAVPGIGYATVNYFLMLLGAPGVKPDRMIHRFLKDATGHGFTNAEAERTISIAAQTLGVQPQELDHVIWRFESVLAQERRESSRTTSERGVQAPRDALDAEAPSLSETG
jgi:hypothetical protein